MDLPARVTALCPFCRLPSEDVVWIKGGSSDLRRSGLKVVLPTSKDLIKKNASHVYIAAWVLVAEVVSLTQRIAITISVHAYVNSLPSRTPEHSSGPHNCWCFFVVYSALPPYILPGEQ